jgi:hypothetical protein
VVNCVIPDTERVLTVDGDTYEVHRHWGRIVVYRVYERDEANYRDGFLTLGGVSYGKHDGKSARKRYLRGHRAIRLAFPEAAVGRPHLARIQAHEKEVLDVVRRQLTRERGLPVEPVTDDDVYAALVAEFCGSAANSLDAVLESLIAGTGNGDLRMAPCYGLPTAPLAVELETPENSNVARVKLTSLGGGVLTTFTVTLVIDIEQPPTCALCVDTETGFRGLSAEEHVDDWNSRHAGVTGEVLEGR